MSTDQRSSGEPISSDADSLKKQLDAAEARFAGIVEIAADAIISVDDQQRICLFNQGAEQTFGYTALEVMGQPLDILLPERYRNVHRKHVEHFRHAPQRARRMGERTAIAGLRKDGTEFPCEASISRYTVGDKTVFNVVLRDITDRTRAVERQRLLATAGELMATGLDLAETIARAAQLAIPTLGSACVIDVFAIEDGPAPACAHVSAERQQALASLCNERPLDVEASSAVAEAIHAGVPIVHRLRELAPDDLIRTVIETAVGDSERGEAAILALVARGRVLGVMVLCRGIRPFDEEDLGTITDLARLMGLAIDNARLYEESQRAIRARDQTIAVVSHDLRNPVNAIRMIANNVLTGVSETGDPALVEYVQVIQQAARQADRLIQDLLDAARIEEGRLRIEPVETPLLPLLRDALEVMLPLAHERGVELKSDLRLREEDVVIVDPGRVHQVVSNLVGNAIKFTPRGGTIVLHASFDEDAVRASVRDTGIGIPADALPHLFDRFWRGREDRRGSGLGLTISKGIVEAHGGRIWVESQVGQGTTVTFELPAKAPGASGA